MNKFWKLLLTALLLVSVLAGLITVPRAVSAGHPADPSPDGLWTDFTETGLQAAGARWGTSVSSYRAVAASNDLQAALSRAPLENSTEAVSPQVISLPLPDGGYIQVSLLESPIMEAPLAARYPHIKTYIAWDPTNPAIHGRLDWASSLGFHAMLYTPDGVFFIDPYRRADTIHYISYYKSAATRSATPFTEYGPLGDNSDVATILSQPGFLSSTGPQLRTYRTVVAATAEYSNYFGGTQEQGQAAIVVSMNRISAIYESEVAVRMVLVANNDQVVFFGDPTKDPYTNDDGVAMLAENQDTIDAKIGNANYDIGHVYSTGGGGVAYLGVPCEAGWKAQGVTGSPAPVGDAYWVDYVAHEMGHQFGANHTFNSIVGSCGGGNRNSLTAYEPGSGTTIMGYAGICGADDIQPHSDAYFHAVSFDEITAYTQSGYGNTCAAITPSGNQTPTVEAGASYSIPKSTPFTLTGSGSDPDGDSITYFWEGFDRTSAGGPPNNPNKPPFFRSFVPVEQASRTFPQISDIVNNVNTKGEILPAVATTLHFRLTVRDNHVAPSAGGVAYDTTTVSVLNITPFTVSEPNTAVTWQAGSQQTVSWVVGSTSAAPINCSTVDISLSLDGGYTYPLSLLAGTPNDGSQAITVPNNPTTTARVKVSCPTNIFFDISNANFTIEPLLIHNLYLPLLQAGQ